MSDGVEALFNEAVSETPAVSQPEQTGNQPRDEGGRFAPKAPDPAPVTPQEPAPQVPAATPGVELPKAEPGHVPIAALLDERDKRQALERRLADLENKTRQPETPPTFQTPEEIAAYVQREAANAAWSAKIDFSESTAREKHGDDAVQAAMDWSLAKCDAEKAQLGFSPFAVEQMRQRNPVDWVVRQHKREEVVSQLGDDPDAWVRQRAAELGLTSAQPQAQPIPAASPQPTAPISAQAAPPRSLASAPTAGGAQSVPTHAVAAVDAVFQ